jgi:tripartite-type tricarboxylate transporter receptor subunit TctC
MLYFRADTPFKTLDDIVQAKEAPKCGSTGTASTGYLLAKLMEEAFKAKLNTVTGYQGGSEIDVAVERGELVCRGMDIPPHCGRPRAIRFMAQEWLRPSHPSRRNKM